MAKIIGMGAEHPETAAITRLGNSLLTSNATVLSQPSCVGNVIGTENYTDSAADAARGKVEVSLISNFDRVRNEDACIKVATESLTQAQKRAGTIILMAQGDLEGYARTAMNTEMPALESGQYDAPASIDGSAGAPDYNAESIGLEYFNHASLDKHLAASFAFNVQAARQSKFAEAFFRTIVADPTECGMLIEIKKTMVHHAVRHSLKEKDNKEFNRRNILDASTDPTVLEDESINFVPHRMPDGENAVNFVPETLMKPYNYDLGDYKVLTSALAFNGKNKRLLSLSAHPGLVNSGYLDESDELDGRVALQHLYLGFNKKGAADDKMQLVRVNTLNLARSSFNKSQEGDGREMTLNFRDSKFAFGAGCRDIANTEVEALQEIIDNRYQITLTVKVNATINLQTGIEDANATPIEILEVKDENGVLLSLEDPTVAGILDALTVSAVGYDYKATRSASNKRTKGLLIDHVVERERYKITLGSPLTSRKPTGTVDDSQRLNDLVVTARVRNDNLSITKLINYTEQLRDVCAARTDDYELCSIEGAGRHYVAPWFDEYNFDVPKMVSNLESTGAQINLANSLLTVIREQVVRAFMESRFQPAIEMLSGYTISKPRVTIGSDVETANWLWVQGDQRTLGDQFEYEIVTTNDIRFRGRIQWAFTVDAAEGGFSPLNFGNHLWVPELVTNTNLTRNDATTNELTVQPRNYHVVNVPITGVILVTGLKKYLRTKPAVDVNVLSKLDGGTGSDGDGILPDMMV